jgi:hypothetical protein
VQLFKGVGRLASASARENAWPNWPNLWPRSPADRLADWPPWASLQASLHPRRANRLADWPPANRLADWPPDRLADWHLASADWHRATEGNSK